MKIKIKLSLSYLMKIKNEPIKIKQNESVQPIRT